MAQHNELGKEGEKIGMTHLLEKGYVIKERNWVRGRLEIDIIAQKGDVLAIVEVKTRTGKFAGEPYLAVNKTKQRNLVIAADRYIKENKLDVNARFDIISVLIPSGGKQEILHIEEAFHPPLR